MAVTQAPTFDELFATTAPRVHEEPEPKRGHWFTSWEDWLTLCLVLLVMVPVTGSLQSANWVDEMPSLMSAGVLGAAAGWLLAQSRVRGLLATGAGALAAFTIVIGLVLQTMERVDFELGEGVRGAWREFWLRLRDWGAALIDGGISADPLPFVVLMVALVFGVGYLASWSVVRWRNPWAAVVPGGVVLLTNISYLPGQPSIAFVIFLVAAVLLVTRLQYLKSAERWDEARVSAPMGMSAEVLGAGTLIGLALLIAAWTVPTANNWGPVSDAWMRVTSPVRDQLDGIGQLFIGVRSKQPLPVHAFGATMPLQGSVTLGAEVLYEVLAEEPGLLRGAVYDEYTGNGWRLSSSASQPLDGESVEAARFGTVETRVMLREPVVTEITVVGEQAPGSMLLTPGDPMAASIAGEFVLGPTLEAFGIAPANGARTGDQYTTVGSVSAATADTLRTAGTDYPATVYGVYTALPEDVPPEVYSLAQSIIGDAATPYDAALRIEAYLRENYTFTLDAPRPRPRQDAVSRFLFDDATGHFDHFASAMAVMLRTVGIPSRVAVGFVLESSDQDSETGAFHITEQDAWAWPEVYFPGYGWVEFNPAPARGAFQRPGDDSDAQRERDAVADSGFFNDPLMDEFYLDLLGWEEDMLGGTVPGASGELATQDEGSGPWLRILTIIVVVSAVAFALLLGVQWLWERRFRGLPPAMRRWGKIQRLAHWAGIAPETYRTPVEAAQDMEIALGPESGTALRALARSYTRARYGPPESTVGESDAEQRELSRHYRSVRGPLWSLVVRRVFRFGRVPDRLLPRRGALVGRRAG